MLSDLLVQAAALSPEHDGRGPGERDLIVEMLATLIESIDPVAAFFKILKSAVDVAHPHHRQVRQRTCGGARNDFREPRGAALRNHDRGRAGGVSGAQDSAQIVGIFDAIEQDVQAAGAGGFFEAGIMLGRAKGDHALMRGARRGSIQLFPRLETYGDAALAAHIDELLQTRTRGAFGDQNVVDRPSGFEGLPDGMDSCEQGHYHKGTLMSAPEHAAKLAPIPEVAPDIPDKLYFRIGEVARLAGIKPYVLRFWETEFPSLGPRKTGTGHRLYRRKDVELVLEIKRLLYEKRFTIEGARKFLETRGRTEPVRTSKPAKKAKIQGDLFVDFSPLLDTVRKELLEIAKILK